MSGVLSRVMIIPGVPDFAKMELPGSAWQCFFGSFRIWDLGFRVERSFAEHATP